MPILNAVEKAVDAWFALLPQPKPEHEAATQAKLIAHRGAHNQDNTIIENTHQAFLLAETQNFWGIELDVHACKDGTLVVHHDADLQRLWNVKAKIADYDYHSLNQLAPQIPTLRSVVERFGKKIHLFIELKSPFTALEALAETLKPLIACQHYHLLSLNEGIFATIEHFPRPSLLLVPLQHNVHQFCKLSIEKGYGGVLGHYLLLTKPKITALNQANQIAGVGFINSKYSLYRELNRGLRYLFTDNAQVVSDELNHLKHQKQPR